MDIGPLLVILLALLFVVGIFIYRIMRQSAISLRYHIVVQVATQEILDAIYPVREQLDIAFRDATSKILVRKLSEQECKVHFRVQPNWVPQPVEGAPLISISCEASFGKNDKYWALAISVAWLELPPSELVKNLWEMVPEDRIIIYPGLSLTSQGYRIQHKSS